MRTSGAKKACGLPASLALATTLTLFLLTTGGLAGCAFSNDTSSTESAELASSGIVRAADGGADRYEPTVGLRDAPLKSALFEIVKDHRSLGYNKARGALLKVPTLTPGIPLECVYSGRIVEPDGTTTPGDFNTEHSWPQSMGANSEPARSDLHHLFPVDARTNGARGNYPFGVVTCLHDETACNFENNGSALGRTAQGQLAFEVRPKKRGDIARAQFYFSVRYKRSIPPNVELVLREWDHEDPIDAEEQMRNDSIERQQNNRNPFVDRPDFTDRIADF
jgi:deoxyribonuclease I